jgi:hypothetical protein
MSPTTSKREDICRNGTQCSYPPRLGEGDDRSCKKVAFRNNFPVFRDFFKYG